MTEFDVRHGDCLEVMASMDAASVDAIVTDPPYGLSFMGKAWDHGVPGEPFWVEALRVAKPGAHLLAFGGTRTFHRLTCAIEDAGWEIRDCLSWLYGSGFPKSHNGPWGGTALKPAWEPIILARKPLVGTVAANVEAHGTGGLNIEGCRIEGVPPSVPQPAFNSPTGMTYGFKAGEGRNGQMSSASGRWPANVVLDEDAAAMLDEQSGDRPVSGAAKNGGGNYNQGGSSPGMFGVSGGDPSRWPNDTGGASRFFYCAKASRSEREKGLEGMPEKFARRYGEQAQGGSPQQTPRIAREAANHHPTVKPIALMRWLCRLVTPQGGLVLDPFTGSGTTGCAAVLEGFRFVGVEREAEYVEIARRRIAHHQPDPMLVGAAIGVVATR